MKMNLLVMMHDGALGISYEGGEGVSCAPNAGWRVEGRGSQTGRAFPSATPHVTPTDIGAHVKEKYDIVRTR